MATTVQTLLDKVAGNTRRKVGGIYAGLVVFNLAAWGWALVAFRHYPTLLGTAFLAYTLGLRHAVDADHIAAIDNVVRKLMQDGQRPLSAGLFFALGHSSVVVLATIAIAATATALQARFGDVQQIGSLIGTTVSAAFLLAIAAINLVILVGVWRSFRSVRSGGRVAPDDLNSL